MKIWLTILMLVVSLSFTGCSLLPRITFDRAGTTPQQTDKSKKKEVCAGEYKVDKNGDIIYCSKGYYLNESDFKQKERAYTFAERVANFIRGLTGWSFWILIALCFLVPGFFGWFIGTIFNVFRTALTRTVKAIGRFKSKIPTVTLNGQEVPDPVYVKAVDALLDELENEHASDANVIRTIANIRVQLKIEDND